MGLDQGAPFETDRIAEVVNNPGASALDLSTPCGKEMLPIAMGGRGLLLVEDDVSLAQLIKMRLEHAGNRVRLAGSVREGLDAIRTERPEILLLDIGLPDGSGMDILRAIREAPATTDLPVIALTGRNSKDNIEEGFVTGVNAYLTKPFEPAELLEAIKILRDERAG